MTASLAVPVVKRTGSIEKLVTGILTLSLLGLYLQFCFERSEVVRLVSVLLLISDAVFLVLFSVKRIALLRTVIHPATAALIIGVCLPPLISSLYRDSGYAAEYGVVMLATIVAVRILLSAIGFEGLLLAFFCATSIGVLAVAGLSFGDLVQSIGSMRYFPLYFQPNDIGFFAITGIPAQFWFSTRERGRKYVLLISAACVFVTIAASSRGSTGALLVGGIITICLFSIKLIREQSFAISRGKVIGALVLVGLLTGVVVRQEAALGDTMTYLKLKLELESRDRGLGSGFTGRATGWSALFGTLPKTYWLSGNGYRTTDDDFSVPIDNGYFSSLYELGLISMFILLVKYSVAIYRLGVAYITQDATPGNWMLMVLFTLLIFFSNAFVHRNFFGFGDQASIFALFALVSTKRDIPRPDLSADHGRRLGTR